jgi:glycine/D-amino acid oxidase-like deaminating enzyme
MPRDRLARLAVLLIAGVVAAEPMAGVPHAHHGFTLGLVTGRLLAEMMTGREPFTDPSCYAASRFAARPAC